LWAGARSQFRFFDLAVLGVPAAFVLIYLWAKGGSGFWTEFGVRVLESVGLLAVLVSVFIWAALKMEPAPDTEPTRRRFLAGAIAVLSGASVGFGRLLPPSTTRVEYALPQDLEGRHVIKKTIRLVDMVSPENRVIRNKFFDECILLGPVVISGKFSEFPNTVIRCTFEECGSWDEAVLGADGDPRGAIRMEGCDFRMCTFRYISFVVPTNEVAGFRKHLARGSRGEPK